MSPVRASPQFHLGLVLVAVAITSGVTDAQEAPPSAVPATYEDALALIRSAQEAKRARPSACRGKVDAGSLASPAMLPFEGFGFTIASRRHRERDLRYGTDDLVFGLAEVAALLAKDRPGAPRLVVGNLSRREGGRISHSFSHQNGRDADLAFFVTDPDSHPYEPKDFVTIDNAATLLGREKESGTRCRLDVAREWDLVVALLESRHFGDRVRELYVWDPIRAKLLAHAAAWADEQPEPEAREDCRRLMKRATELLSQPEHAGAHDDHLHLRIGCGAKDAKAGCED